MDKAHKKAYLELHIAVFLFGFTAILGDLIQLPAISIVWWRVLLTSISLVFLIKLGSLFNSLTRRQIFMFLGIGFIVGLHWLCFYGAIKYANASIALICMATTSLFTSFIEPFILKKKLFWLEIALGFVIIPAMILIVQSTEWSMLPGIWIGLLAAFLAALFAVLNKKNIALAAPMDITFLEITGAWLLMSVILPFYLKHADQALFLPRGMDWVYLIIMVLLCTSLAYYLALRSLHYLSAFASNLVINLEPVYGIFLAIIILKDHKDLSLNFYIGVSIIIAAVFIYPLAKKKFKPKI
jgi:drug/metabolite transporter (DMT)-like permease